MASEFLSRLNVLDIYAVGDTFSIGDAWVDVSCAHCGSSPTHMVAEIEEVSRALFCSYCMKPTVVWVDDEGNLQSAPAKQPSKAPMGTPDNIEDAWVEGERCFYAGAYSAAAMIYRKLIFLVATSCGMPPKNDKGFAPGFDKCLNYLVLEKHISSEDKEYWADTICIIGNKATHEIDPITGDQAEALRSLVRVVLQTVYERKALAQKAQGVIIHEN